MIPGSHETAAAHARRTAAHAKAPPSQRATPRGVRPVFELRAGGSNPKAVPRTAQSLGGLPPLEVDSTHRRLPVASDPSTLTFYGGNVPKGTGVMQSELRGELGEEADLSGATWPRSWTRPLGIRDAAVRLGGGEHGAQRPVERPPVSVLPVGGPRIVGFLYGGMLGAPAERRGPNSGIWCAGCLMCRR